MSDAIRCPKCGTSIEVAEVLAAQIEARLADEMNRKARAELEALRTKLEREREAALEQVRKEAEDRAKKRARADFEADVADLKGQVEDQAKKLQAAREAELELRRKAREAEDKAREADLELQRRLDTERARIADEAVAAKAEEFRLKQAENDERIRGLLGQIESLKQKAEQGSMQTQGEAQEVLLEADLKALFPLDGIGEVPKGMRGADCVQTVAGPGGQPGGVILWESKRTKAWGGDWTKKLKEDQRAAKADVAVLVSQVLPEGVRHAGLYDGVWVCDFATFPGLAHSLRHGLLLAAQARAASSGKGSKMEGLYDYLTGTEFRGTVEGVVEAFSALKADIDTERRAMEKAWARREKSIEQVVKNMTRMYGSLQGIAGTASLPELKAFALPGADGAEA
jgi:hypothetical protein